jgi:hypothetical protein
LTTNKSWIRRNLNLVHLLKVIVPFTLFFEVKRWGN